MKSVPAFRNNKEFADVVSGTGDEPYLVAAARYGLLTPQPGTHFLFPQAAVTRAEFVKMLAFTYGLPAPVKTSYPDVVPSAWYAPYAGWAQRYALFQTDPDQEHFHPEAPLRRTELALALRTFLALREGGHASGFIRLKKQSPFRVTLYQRISTQTDEMTIVNVPLFLLPNDQVQRTLPPIARPAVTPLPDIGQLRLDVVTLVNAERARNGLKPLLSNATLEQSAQAYADEMVQKGFFDHVSPDGATLRDRMKHSAFGKPFLEPDCLCIRKAVIGENLARAATTPLQAFNAWMASKKHREAMLDPRFTDIGVGVKGDIWVQHFGGLIP